MEKLRTAILTYLSHLGISKANHLHTERLLVVSAFRRVRFHL